MKQKRLLFVVTGALGIGVMWAGSAMSTATATSGAGIVNQDYERAVERMASPDFAFADVSLEIPEEAPVFLLAADSKTCSQRCSTRCSVGCTTTRGCSTRCKVQTAGCGGGTGSSSTGGASLPTAPTAAPTTGHVVSYSPVTTAPTVTNLKRALIAAGYHLCVDDSMDQLTRKAIFEFQRKNHLVPSGDFNTATQAALVKVLERIAE